ncbi:hypothetical protein D3C84_1085060 [compost metagenome]
MLSLSLGYCGVIPAQLINVVQFSRADHACAILLNAVSHSFGSVVKLDSGFVDRSLNDTAGSSAKYNEEKCSQHRETPIRNWFYKVSKKG